MRHGFHISRLDRPVSRFLPDAVALRVRILFVELEQPRREDVRLLLRADDVELALELRQRHAGPLHLGAKLLLLLLHELREPGGGAVADVVGVLQIRLRDSVGDVGGEPLVLGAVADQDQICIGRARDLELLEQHRRVFGVRLLHGLLVPILVLQFAQLVLPGRDRAQGPSRIG